MTPEGIFDLTAQWAKSMGSTLSQVAEVVNEAVASSPILQSKPSSNNSSLSSSPRSSSSYALPTTTPQTQSPQPRYHDFGNYDIETGHTEVSRPIMSPTSRRLSSFSGMSMLSSSVPSMGMSRRSSERSSDYDPEQGHSEVDPPPVMARRMSERAVVPFQRLYSETRNWVLREEED